MFFFPWRTMLEISRCALTRMHVFCVHFVSSNVPVSSFFYYFCFLFSTVKVYVCVSLLLFILAVLPLFCDVVCCLWCSLFLSFVFNLSFCFFCCICVFDKHCLFCFLLLSVFVSYEIRRKTNENTCFLTVFVHIHPLRQTTLLSAIVSVSMS